MYIVHGFSDASYTVIEGESLHVTFQINVKGISRFDRLSLAGDFLAKNDTASKSIFLHVPLTVFVDMVTLGLSDFEHIFIPLHGVTTSISFILNTIDDVISLEYNEQVILSYAPNPPVLIDLIEEAGEFIRNIAPVTIKDNDS